MTENMTMRRDHDEQRFRAAVAFDVDPFSTAVVGADRLLAGLAKEKP